MIGVRVSMASTPKIVRRMTKRTRRMVSNYFGFPVYASVTLGADNRARTRKGGGKPKSRITLVRDLLSGRISIEEAQKVLEHEFFHAGHDAFLIAKSGVTQRVMSEVFAMLANAENVFRGSRDSGIVDKYIVHQETKLRQNPPKEQEHRLALPIMLNILKSYPDRKARQRYLRELLEKNASALKGLKDGQEVSISPLGQVRSSKK